MIWRSKQKGTHSPVRLLLWTAIAGLVLTFIGLSPPAEDLLRVARNHFRPHSASGDIVLVTIDNRALQQIGRWPWPRRYHAQLIDRLTAAGAKNIAFDITFETQSDPANDRALAEALTRSGRVTLPVRGQSGPHGNAQQSPTPLTMFNRHARLGSIAVEYNYQNAVWRLPYTVNVNGTPVRSYASLLSGRNGGEETFTVDYSIDPSTVPTINAADVISGHFDPRLVRGKEVIVGTDSDTVGDQYFIPGLGKMGGVYVQILGAETLKAGKPLDLGWVPAMFLVLALIFTAVSRTRPAQQNLILAAGVTALLLGPVYLDAHLIFVDVTPALFVLTIVWAMQGWRTMRKRGLVNATSGLPNLDALRAHPAGKGKALIAGRIFNYEEIAAALPPNSERQLIDQIVLAPKGRLTRSRALPGRRAGIFAWFEEPGAPFGNHLDALYSLFRNPARVAGLPLDLSLAFGVELGEQSLARQPACKCAGCRRRSRARRAQMEISRSGEPRGRVVEALNVKPARRRDRQGRGMGRLPAQARSRHAPNCRRRGARPLDSSRKGSDRRI